MFICLFAYKYVHQNILNYLFVILVFLLLSACSTKVHHSLYSTPVDKQKLTQAEHVLSIQYLGVGGHLFRFADASIMTAPFFSNPSLLRLGPFMPIASDTQAVDKYLPNVQDVQMILVGHAHYDHLMDVPYIMQQHAPLAQVYGSKTMKHAIAPALEESRLHALNSKMATAQRMGQWIYNPSRSARIMAVESMHAPHFLGITVMTGRYDQDLQKLPWHAFAWKEGQTLAFVIDFLDVGGDIKHRVFYQDSASESPKALLPAALLAEKSVDIAIITPASYQEVVNYPEYVLENTQAQHVILGHWEDFFGNDIDAKMQRFVRNSNQKKFFERLKSALPEDRSYVLPELFSTQYFAPKGQLIE